MACSRQFLQSIGCYIGDMPRARGKVKEIRKVGDVILANVDWNLPDIPERINVANLVLVIEREILE